MVGTAVSESDYRNVAAAATPLHSMARLPTLDGLRGFAILAVLLYRTDYLFVIPHGFIAKTYHGLTRMGWSGVDLFFVLSGFLITGILYDSKNKVGYFRVFYIRRVLRIFPLYYGFLTLFYVVLPPMLIATGHATAVRDIIKPSTQIVAWLYVVNWFARPVHHSYVSYYIAHFWSLAIEEQFYLLWPAAVKFLNRARLKKVCYALVVGSLVSRLVLCSAGLQPQAYSWTICRMDGIAVGALIALSMRAPVEWEAIRKRAPLVSSVSLVLFVTLSALGQHSRTCDFLLWTIGNTALVLMFGSWLVFALSSTTNAINIACSQRFAQEAGKYSYGAYVLHQPLLNLLQSRGFGTQMLVPYLHSEVLSVLVVTLVALIITTAAALLSWHLIEKQFLKLKEPLSMKVLGAERVANMNGAAVS